MPSYCVVWILVLVSVFISPPSHPACPCLSSSPPFPFSAFLSSKLHLPMTRSAVSKESKHITRNLNNRPKKSPKPGKILFANWQGKKGFSCFAELKPHLLWAPFTLGAETCERIPSCFRPSMLGYWFLSPLPSKTFIFDLKKTCLIFWEVERETFSLSLYEREPETEMGRWRNLSQSKAWAFLLPTPLFISFPPGTEAGPCQPQLGWTETIIHTFSHISAISFFF